MQAEEKLNLIKEILKEAQPKQYGKIGIGINAHNRHEMLKTCLEHIEKYRPPNSVIVIIDDASTVPVQGATFRFDKNAGVAVAKNKTLELLYKQDCDHYFLFDEDCWAIHEDWYKPYVESNEPHLNYIFLDFANGVKLNDTKILYQDKDKFATSHTRGCMLYFKKICLDVVGGMCPDFGRWGFEHPQLSDRVFNAGLTSFRYMDVVNSDKLIYSHDENHHNEATTVKGPERAELVKRNKALYDQIKGNSNFIPFYEKENIFLTCYFTCVKDTQGRVFKPDLNALMPLIKSVKETKLIVLHDCFVEEQLTAVKQYNVEFVKVETSINVYFQRYVSYREYIMKNKNWIENVFLLDGTDVEILKEPNWQQIGGLYFGDENCELENEWLRKYHNRPEAIQFLNDYGKKFQLLNCGIIGGDIKNVLEFCRLMVNYYSEWQQDTTDMLAGNCIARMKFNHILTTGRQVNTDFKGNKRNDYSWFRHK